MIALSVATLALVGAAIIHVAHTKRSLAERLVDALYRAHAVTYAAAQAADSALCRYRTARREIRNQHTPMYAEVRQ